MNSYSIEFLANERRNDLLLDAERIRTVALVFPTVDRVESLIRGLRWRQFGRLVLFLRNATI